ncbi:stretch-activated cation channel Mid1 [Malassezia pachydermatis]|uniref:Calcium channel subunit mid1 n=1 Tax=Malassezia pachydermatis TaxID=77020 RepID=A0A0M9VQS2_9BASI|nr:calcium channel subunit mid1 [Malassezia pachydermatis]KOS15839.1 calcium channel subunit mid1 [Malassezia pachydermatis]
MQRWALVGLMAMLLACMSQVVYSAKPSSTTSSSSQTVSSSSGLVSSSNPFQLPTQSTASFVRASTGIGPQSSIVPVVASDSAPYVLQDGVTARSELNINATDGLFFSFNATRDVPIWVSLSLCNGPGIPAYNTSNKTLLNELGLTPFQARVSTLVSVYVSTDAGTQRPGPNHSVLDGQIGYAQGGWTQIVLEDGSDNGAWIGVWPPADARGMTGSYQVQISASTRGSLESVATQSGLFFDDTDAESALLTSFNFTSPAPNISLIVLPTEGAFSLTSITYFNSSFCRIFDLWQDMAWRDLQPMVNSSETSRGTVNVITRGGSKPSSNLPTSNINDTAGIQPLVPQDNDDDDDDDGDEKRSVGPLFELAKRQSHAVTNATNTAQVRKQFYVDGLSPGTNYTAYLVSSQNVSGLIHRTLYPAVKFVTKSTRNCKLMYNLNFCPELAYAVPYNPSMSMSDTLSVLENIVSSNYGNFSATLNTFPCGSDEFGLYSTVATCDACRQAYQTWLCAVAIPRCTDLMDPSKSAASQNGTELEGLPMPANTKLYPYVVNRIGPGSSRQPYIDKLFNPGNYGELLPCIHTCEMVTRSCPPVIQWSCPRWTVTAQRDYGTFADADAEGMGVGENGGAGPGGLRYGGAPSRYVAQDAFGHVYCNAMNVDRLLRQASAARRQAQPLAWIALVGWTGIASAVALCLSGMYTI